MHQRKKNLDIVSFEKECPYHDLQMSVLGLVQLFMAHYGYTISLQCSRDNRKRQDEGYLPSDMFISHSKKTKERKSK